MREVWAGRWASLLFRAAAVLVGLVGAELFVRMLMPWPWYGYPLGRWQVGLVEYHATLGWHGRPSIRVPFVGRDFAVTVSHDAEGHRSSAPPFDPARRNFVAIGASSGWGWGVEDDEVWAAQMMQRNPGLNVYNLSMPGWGTDQYTLELLDFLDEHPDAPLEGVIVILAGNDCAYVLGGRSIGPKPYFDVVDDELVLRNVPVPDDWVAHLAGERVVGEPDTHAFRRFHFLNLMDRGLPRLFGRGRHAEQRSEPSRQTIREGLPLVLRLLREVEEAAAARGARLLVGMPDARAGEEPYETLARFLDARGIAHAYLERRRIPQTHLWYDGHPSARGHRLLATGLLGLVD